MVRIEELAVVVEDRARHGRACRKRHPVGRIRRQIRVRQERLQGRRYVVRTAERADDARLLQWVGLLGKRLPFFRFCRPRHLRPASYIAPILIFCEHPVCRKKRLVREAEDVCRVLRAARPEHQATCLERRRIAEIDADHTRELTRDWLVFVCRQWSVCGQDHPKARPRFRMAARAVNRVCRAQPLDAAHHVFRPARRDRIHVERHEIAADDVRRLPLPAVQRTADEAADVLEPYLLALWQAVIRFDRFLCPNRRLKAADELAPKYLRALPILRRAAFSDTDVYEPVMLQDTAPPSPSCNMDS